MRGRLLYETLKFVHILFAIIAVGGNLSYPFWFATTRNRQVLPYVLRRIRDFDRFVANPSYVALLLTGGALVWAGNWSWTTWIVLALALWVIVAAMGTGLFLPSLKRQIDALDRHGYESQTYGQHARTTQLWGMLNMVPVLVILVLMVYKPSGWF